MPNITNLAEDCWALVRHGRAPEFDELIGAAGIAILGIVLARFAWAVAASLRSRRRDRRVHWDLLRIAQPAGASEAGVLWLDHRMPFAFSVGGRPGLVVATTGLRALPETQRDAVLCHEAAHLRGRHHLLVALTHDLATVLPIVPLFRHAPPLCGSWWSSPPTPRQHGPVVGPPSGQHCLPFTVGPSRGRHLPWRAGRCRFGYIALPNQTATAVDRAW